MTEQDPNGKPAEHVDCSDEAAKRAGAAHTSLKQEDDDRAKPDVDKDDVSEADLDEAIEESMDASDPPSITQP